MESKMIAPQQAGNGGLKHGGPNYQSGAGTGQGPGGPGGGGGNAGPAQPTSPSRLFVSTILEPNQGDLDIKHESYFNTGMLTDWTQARRFLTQKSVNFGIKRSKKPFTGRREQAGTSDCQSE